MKFEVQFFQFNPEDQFIFPIPKQMGIMELGKFYEKGGMYLVSDKEELPSKLIVHKAKEVTDIFKGREVTLPFSQKDIKYVTIKLQPYCTEKELKHSLNNVFEVADKGGQDVVEGLVQYISHLNGWFLKLQKWRNEK